MGTTLWCVWTILGYVAVCHAACTFPTDLVGDWYSNSYGTLTFTSASFSGFTSGLSAGPLTFICHEVSGNQYVSKSTFFVSSNVQFTLYLCMDLTKISDVKYVFRLDGNIDASSGVRVFGSSQQTATLAEACARTDARLSGEYHVLVKTDSVASAMVSCPGGLASYFDVALDGPSITNCTNNTLDGRQNSFLTFNFSSCATGLANSERVVQCLYWTSDDYVYVTLYNSDSTLALAHRFSCMTFSKSGATLLATEYASTCHTNQTPTSVLAPGMTYRMTDMLYTPESPKDYTTVIIVVCSVIGAIIIVIVIIILYIKCCTRTPIEKVRTKKKKPEIIDYTPRTLGRASSVEKDLDKPVHKASAIELLSGIADTKTGSLEAYEPLKKEAWQNKWERSPRLDRSLQRSKMFSSADSVAVNIPVLALDKAYTVSSSLPESIDIPSTASTHTSPRVETERIPSSRENVIPWSPARAKIPESTGKFGGECASPGLIATVTHDYTLHTIDENPLSRENTSSWMSSKNKRPHDVSALSVYSYRPSSRSTASVGDIRLQNSLQNVSRISHLSASNASIFDDPVWLMENKQETEKNQRLEQLKELIPNFPKHRDTKWFLRPNNAPTSVPREDLEYMKRRTSVNIGQMNGTSFWAVKKSSSLEIINNEKKRQKTKLKKTKPKLVTPFKTS